MQLSVIIITHNEEANIGDCLHSVAFADEVIVLDNASTDATREIARNMGAQVHVTSSWPGFGAQKNRALNLASGDWILSLDADERVTSTLQAEISQAIHPCGDFVGAAAFEIARSSSFCGQFIRHSGWSPDYVLRLFRRGQARFSDDLVHERVIFAGSPARLRSPMLHLSYTNFEMVLEKLDRYSTAGARDMANSGQTASLACAVGHGIWAFLRTYVLRCGFLDGQLGFALAIYNAECTYYRYLKLWLMRRSDDTHS